MSNRDASYSFDVLVALVVGLLCDFIKKSKDTCSESEPHGDKDIFSGTKIDIEVLILSALQVHHWSSRSSQTISPIASMALTFGIQPGKVLHLRAGGTEEWHTICLLLNSLDIAVTVEPRKVLHLRSRGAEHHWPVSWLIHVMNLVIFSHPSKVLKREIWGHHSLVVHLSSEERGSNVVVV